MRVNPEGLAYEVVEDGKKMCALTEKGIQFVKDQKADSLCPIEFELSAGILTCFVRDGKVFGTARES